jgi:hypothetical protein
MLRLGDLCETQVKSTLPKQKARIVRGYSVRHVLPLGMGLLAIEAVPAQG